jgi:hypothetical protein
MKTAPAKVRPVRKSRRWLRPRVIAYALLGIIPLGLIGGWIASALMASHALGTAESDADRLDPGWRFNDVLAKRAVIPFEQNSARQVLAVLQNLGGGFPRLPKVRRTATGAPLERQRDDVVDRLGEVAAWDRFDNALASDIRRELRRVAPAVAEARKLATMDRGRTDPAYAKLLWGTLLPHIQNTRSVAKLLQADAALRSHDGDPDGALESSRACLNAGRSVGDEPFMVSQLVRMACLGRAVAATDRALNQGEPSDDAMAKLQSLLLDEADQPLALTALRGERATIDSVFSQLAQGEATYRQAMGSGGIIADPAAEFLTSVSGAFVRYNHGLALARMNEAVEIAKLPAPEQPAFWDERERQPTASDNLVARIASSLSREAVLSLGSCNHAYLRSRSQLYAMAILLAAERHRRAHGAFPASIEAIDPRFLSRRLIDPYSGGPMRYKSDGEGGLIVYSFSHDRQDNGGVLKLRNWTAKGSDLGFRLRGVAGRGLPPKVDNLPLDVFHRDPKAEEDEVEGP